MTPIEKLIDTATKEIGYLEKQTNSKLDDKTTNVGLNNWTKYARDLDALKVYNGQKNGYAWCDVFADWCFVTTFGLDTAMKMTYQPTSGGYGASCTQSAQYYKKNNAFYTSNPLPGDQVFFTNKTGQICHTGLVVKVDSNKIYTIEGNTSSDAGVIDNGGSVNDKNYPINYNRIAGYGRPNYSLANIEEEDDDMDVERFKELWLEMRKDLQDNDCSSWSQASRQWATSNGLINGSGITQSGEPNYMWNDLLTREQAAALLYRFAQLIGKA